MGRRIGFALATGVMLVSLPAAAGDRYELRAPGGLTASSSNEVGVWKTAKAAQRAHSSLATGNQFMSPDLECIVRPGVKAELFKREGSVAYVRASSAVFGGCKGYVKTEFLSEN